MISFWKRAHRHCFQKDIISQVELRPREFFTCMGLIAQRFQKVIIRLSINKNREFFMLMGLIAQCFQKDIIS